MLIILYSLLISLIIILYIEALEIEREIVKKAWVLLLCVSSVGSDGCMWPNPLLRFMLNSGSYVGWYTSKTTRLILIQANKETKSALDTERKKKDNYCMSICHYSKKTKPKNEKEIKRQNKKNLYGNTKSNSLSIKRKQNTAIFIVTVFTRIP